MSFLLSKSIELHMRGNIPCIRIRAVCITQCGHEGKEQGSPSLCPCSSLARTVRGTTAWSQHPDTTFAVLFHPRFSYIFPCLLQPSLCPHDRNWSRVPPCCHANCPRVEVSPGAACQQLDIAWNPPGKCHSMARSGLWCSLHVRTHRRELPAPRYI